MVLTKHNTVVYLTLGEHGKEMLKSSNPVAQISLPLKHKKSAAASKGKYGIRSKPKASNNGLERNGASWAIDEEFCSSLYESESVDDDTDNYYV